MVVTRIGLWSRTRVQMWIIFELSSTHSTNLSFSIIHKHKLCSISDLEFCNLNMSRWWVSVRVFLYVKRPDQPDRRLIQPTTPSILSSLHWSFTSTQQAHTWQDLCPGGLLQWPSRVNMDSFYNTKEQLSGKLSKCFSQNASLCHGSLHDERWNINAWLNCWLYF